MHEKDQDDIEKLISDLYSDTSLEKPSSELDEKIMLAARKELQQETSGSESDPLNNGFSGKGAGPFSGRWTVPASLAAVIILSVTVIVTIEKERPYELTSVPDELPEIEVVDSSDGESVEKSAAKVLPEKPDSSRKQLKLKQKEKESQRAAEVTQKQERIALADKVEAESRSLATRTAPVVKKKSDVVERRKLIASDDDKGLSENIASAVIDAPESTRGKDKSNTEVAVVPQLAENTVKAKPPIPTEAESPPSEQEPKVSQDSAVSASGALAAFTSEEETEPDVEVEFSDNSLLAKSADAQKSTIAATEQESIPSDEPSVALAEPAAMMAAPATHNAFASGSAVSENLEQENCSALLVSDCLAAKECTLELDEANAQYQCRVSKDLCEKGFSQAEDSQELCEAKSGCKYQVANCFCPPGVECVCGGGLPAACVTE